MSGGIEDGGAALTSPGGWMRRIHWFDSAALARRMRAATPDLLFGVRLWIAVCLALYIAFWLELDNAQWAGTSAAIVCQPSLGASLRKGSFRMIGTMIGAVMVVLLTAWFPQDRVGFFLGLALWGALCALTATILHNFTAYAAALAGYTAAIIASDTLGATGGASDAVFLLAVDRASEICIGILCAGVVVAATDLGDARHRLAARLAAIAAEITGRLAGGFLLPPREQASARPVRRGLVARVAALAPVIDETIGEPADLRYRARRLQAGVDALLAALTGWRNIANCLERMPERDARREAEIILRSLPRELRAAPVQGEAPLWIAEPSRLRALCRRTARYLVVLPVDTPSLRLMVDGTVTALLAVSRALDSVALLRGERARRDPPRQIARPHVADPLPACINALRAFVAIAAVEIFWIATAWPSGGLALIFTTIGVTLFVSLGDRAYVGSKMFLLGTCVTAVLAGLVKFAALPAFQTFPAFALVIGLVLVPAGALAAQRPGSVFTAMTVNFIPLLAPANEMTYDTAAFYNTTLAIIAGMGAPLLAMQLLPPLSPQLRASRLLALTLRDLRRIAAGRITPSTGDWEGRIYGRIAAMPPGAELVQPVRLVAALSVGSEIIRLRRTMDRLGLRPDLDAALEALAAGDSELARERLARLDRRLATQPHAIGLRARGRIMVISQALSQHGAYFDGQAPR